MRTSRGLRITSLIVVSPVILILISLVIILAIAVQSQVKAWYFAAVSTLPPHQPFFNEPSPQFINTRSISRLASTAFVFSYNHPTAQLPASLDASNRIDTPKVTVATTRRILPRLKRLLPSSTWIGVLTVFALITLQKVPLQPLKSIASCITSPPGEIVDRPETKLSRPVSKPRRKRVRRAVRKSAAAPAAPQQQQQQPADRSNTSATTEPVQHTLEDHSSIESSDDDENAWINVGEKKRNKKPKPTPEQLPEVPPEEQPSAEEKEDDDDDSDDTATEDEVESVTKTPVMEKPRIQSWYSPFSTGLDLDIMPKGSDLLLNKPLAPPMNGDLFFRHHQLDRWKSQQEYPLMQRRAEPFTFFDHY
ncbi:hypothetical protein BJV82DRAFT_626813 [Fennellomyces sp. T-0311]|nr:hypothetical protein BJV82DRAFT_626813 [Fennellomyces sp. T-0311]